MAVFPIANKLNGLQETICCSTNDDEDYRRALIPFSNVERKRPIFSTANPCNNYPPLTDPLSCLCDDRLQQPNCLDGFQTTYSNNCCPPGNCNYIFLMNCNCGPIGCPNFSQYPQPSDDFVPLLDQERRNGLQKHFCDYNKDEDVKEYERALIPFPDDGKINKRRPIFSACDNSLLQDPWWGPCCDNTQISANMDNMDCFIPQTSVLCRDTVDKAGILDPCNGYPCLQEPCYDPCFANYRMPCMDHCYDGFQKPSSCNSLHQNMSCTQRNDKCMTLECNLQRSNFETGPTIAQADAIIMETKAKLDEELSDFTMYHKQVSDSTMYHEQVAVSNVYREDVSSSNTYNENIIESNMYGGHNASVSNTYPNNRCGCSEGFICIGCDPEIPTPAESCCCINLVLPKYLQSIAEKARCYMPNNAQTKDAPLCLQPCSVSSLEAKKSLESLTTVNIVYKHLSWMQTNLLTVPSLYLQTVEAPKDEEKE